MRHFGTFSALTSLGALAAALAAVPAHAQDVSPGDQQSSQTPPPAPQPFCTRSLGTVDCWAGADSQPQPARRGLADGPTTLTPEQEAHRTRGWPGLSIGN